MIIRILKIFEQLTKSAKIRGKKIIDVSFCKQFNFKLLGFSYGWIHLQLVCLIVIISLNVLCCNSILFPQGNSHKITFYRRTNDDGLLRHTWLPSLLVDGSHVVRPTEIIFANQSKRLQKDNEKGTWQVLSFF